MGMTNPNQEWFDTTRAFYNKHAQRYVTNTKDMFDHEWLEEFVKLLPQKGRILDAGCAGGRDSIWFAHHGFEVCGIDTSEEMIRLAKAADRRPQFSVMNLLSLDFPNNYFDGVWSSCVLLHIPHALLRSAIAELCRVTKPLGHIYILVKEGNREGIEKDERYAGDEKFSSYFEENELAQALLESGAHSVRQSSMDRRVDEYRAKKRVFLIARKAVS
jgi:SAM-dependent methyltransferase